MLDEVVKWISLAASVATVAAIVFLIRQIQIGIEQVRLASDTVDVGIRQMSIAQSSLDEDRKERVEQRRLLRKTLWVTLQTEVTSILNGANSNLARFRPVNHGNPQEEEAFQDRDVKGEFAYNRSFVWTSISITTLEQIMGQMHVLDLKPEEIQTLHDLRLQALRVNSLAAAKIALLPNLVQGGVPPRQPSLQWHRWAEMEADQLNLNLENGSHQIGNISNKIAAWVSAKNTET